MDPLSLAASVASLMALAGTLAPTLRSIKDHTPSSITVEINKIQAELESVCGVLGQIHPFLESEFDDDSALSKNLSDNINVMVTDCGMCFRGLMDVTESIQRSNAAKRVIKWYFVSGDLEKAKHDLTTKKASINITLSLVNQLSLERIAKVDKKVDEITEGTYSNSETTVANTEDIQATLAKLVDALTNGERQVLSNIVRERWDTSSIIMRRFLQEAQERAPTPAANWKRASDHDVAPPQLRISGTGRDNTDANTIDNDSEEGLFRSSSPSTVITDMTADTSRNEMLSASSSKTSQSSQKRDDNHSYINNTIRFHVTEPPEPIPPQPGRSIELSNTLDQD